MCITDTYFINLGKRGRAHTFVASSGAEKGLKGGYKYVINLSRERGGFDTSGSD